MSDGQTISCRDYRAHQLEHIRVNGAWRCPPCEAAAVEPAGGRDTSPPAARDPLSPQWEDCRVRGGDHWTKDHPARSAAVDASADVELDTSSRDPGDAGQLVIDPSDPLSFAVSEGDVLIAQSIRAWRASRRAALEGGHRP